MNQCGCCWRATDDNGADLRMGSMTDPNGHKWKICADCITFMWRGRHPMQDADVMNDVD